MAKSSQSDDEDLNKLLDEFYSSDKNLEAGQNRDQKADILDEEKNKPLTGDIFEKYTKKNNNLDTLGTNNNDKTKKLEARMTVLEKTLKDLVQKDTEIISTLKKTQALPDLEKECLEKQTKIDKADNEKDLELDLQEFNIDDILGESDQPKTSKDSFEEETAQTDAARKTQLVDNEKDLELDLQKLNIDDILGESDQPKTSKDLLEEKTAQTDTARKTQLVDNEKDLELDLQKFNIDDILGESDQPKTGKDSFEEETVQTDAARKTQLVDNEKDLELDLQEFNIDDILRESDQPKTSKDSFEEETVQTDAARKTQLKETSKINAIIDRLKDKADEVAKNVNSQSSKKKKQHKETVYKDSQKKILTDLLAEKNGKQSDQIISKGVLGEKELQGNFGDDKESGDILSDFNKQSKLSSISKEKDIKQPKNMRNIEKKQKDYEEISQSTFPVNSHKIVPNVTIGTCASLTPGQIILSEKFADRVMSNDVKKRKKKFISVEIALILIVETMQTFTVEEVIAVPGTVDILVPTEVLQGLHKITGTIKLHSKEDQVKPQNLLEKWAAPGQESMQNQIISAISNGKWTDVKNLLQMVPWSADSLLVLAERYSMWWLIQEIYNGYTEPLQILLFLEKSGNKVWRQEAKKNPRLKSYFRIVEFR